MATGRLLGGMVGKLPISSYSRRQLPGFAIGDGTSSAIRGEGGVPEADIVGNLWRDHQLWSEAASSLQSRIKALRRVQLVLAAAGALLATASATLTLDAVARSALAAVSTLAIAFTAFIAQHFLSSKLVDRWPRARSISEGLKSEVFKYRAAAGPYAIGSAPDGNTPLELLVERASEIQKAGADLRSCLPPMPSRPTNPPSALSSSAYLRLRLDEQIEGYYLKRSRENQGLATRFRRLNLAFLAAATAISALTAVGMATQLGAWVAVATTISVAFATHSAVNRFEFLASTYARQAGELRHLALKWQARSDRNQPQAWSEFVLACEETISAENRAWMAKMTEEVKGVADVVKAVSGERE